MEYEKLYEAQKAETATLSAKLTEKETALAEATAKLMDAEKAKSEAETKLSETLAGVRKASETARRDELLASGKLLPAEKDSFLETLCELPEATATKLFEARKAGTPIVTLGEIGSDKGGENKTTLSHFEKFEKEFLAENPEGDALSAFAEKFPEEAKKLS